MRTFCFLAIFGLWTAVGTSACQKGQQRVPNPTVWGRVIDGDPNETIRMERAKRTVGRPAPVLGFLADALRTNLMQLQAKDLEHPAYFLAYDLIATDELWLLAEDGALVRGEHETGRVVDVDIRVGSPKLDNSHAASGRTDGDPGLGSGNPVSLDDIGVSLAQSLWLDTEVQYHNAVDAFLEVQGESSMRTEAAQRHPDFSREEPVVHIEAAPELAVETLRDHYQDIVGRVSTELANHRHVLTSQVGFSAVVETHHYVNSEGGRVQTSGTRLRLTLQANGQADDGMALQRTATFEAHLAQQLPSLQQLLATAARLRGELLALRVAPIADPFTGPAVLEGRAAGVFFHEIFGHRLEGHRQKDDLEGQTFTGKLGHRVLPAFLDVTDDPTVSSLGGVPLSGHYFVDHEGVQARGTSLVERGKLTGFLLSRSPVLPFKRSNGHGRREAGYPIVARQGNLIVTSRKTLNRRQLRAALLAEIERQDKPYGLSFHDIEGGYTLTDRTGPQAFKVQPLMVYRIYADRRPDELVRGVEIVGTPLAAFETILATDDEPGIFNGLCGAESGWIPVSAVSPSLLLRNIEIERSIHDRERPPLLEPPPSVVETTGDL